MATRTVAKHPTVEFSNLQVEELKTLRAYVEKLNELSATLTTELPSDAQALQSIKNELSNTAKKIVDLEILKIQAELKFKVK